MKDDPELQALMAQANKNEKLLFWASDIYRPDWRYTSGWLGLDWALKGGFAPNQWSEIIGMESVAKTGIVNHIVAANQAVDENFVVAWVAAEEFVADYAEMCGVDLSRVLLIDTNVMEEAYSNVYEVLDKRAVDCVVIDSYPALIPLTEDEKEFEDWQVGLGARITGKATRKFRKATRRSLEDSEDRPVFGIMINQFREKVGGFSPVPGQTPKTTPGGLAKNFFFSARIQLSRDDWITEGKTKVGQTIQALVLKNKYGPAQRRANVDFYFDDAGDFPAGSLDTTKDVVSTAIASGVIARKGAYYHFGGHRWQGQERVFAALAEDGELLAEVWTAVADGAVPAVEEAPPEEEPKPRRTRKRKK